jgi:hypothetical protein
MDAVIDSCVRCRFSHVAPFIHPNCPTCREQQALNALSRPLRLQALRQIVDRSRRVHAEMVPAGVA